jgi:hypothetical protein
MRAVVIMRKVEVVIAVIVRSHQYYLTTLGTKGEYLQVLEAAVAVPEGTVLADSG